MTSKEELLINQLATAQSSIVSLTRQNKELLAIIKEGEILFNESVVNFDTMVEQRDQFINLAKSLDKDFNQGKIFNK